MANTYLISGGNSGIGLEVGRQLASGGHHVVLLGRDPAKGEAAVRHATAGGGTAEFVAADLSTHAGVRAVAEKLASKHQRLDGLVLGAGVLMMGDARTSDGLHPIFATNYLSRYHLAQRLMPQLRASRGSVVLLVAGVNLATKVNFEQFPRFDPFPGMGALSSIQIANHHYAQHLATAEPTIRAGVVNVGLVKTDIMRAMPLPLRLGFMVAGPLITVSVETSAANATWLATHSEWKSGSYWVKPGRIERSQVLSLDAATSARVVEASRALTGV